MRISSNDKSWHECHDKSEYLESRYFDLSCLVKTLDRNTKKEEKTRKGIFILPTWVGISHTFNEIPTIP